MKTILYLITQSEIGGAQRYCLDLAKNLKNKFNVIIAFGEQGESGELAKKFQSESVAYYILPHLKRAISSLNDFLALIEIIKLIKKIKPDIIHLNSSKISILGSLAGWFCQMSNVKCQMSIIYTVHGWVFNEPLPYWQKLFYKYAEKITAHFKDKLICVSEFDRQLALKEKIAPTEKLITIHNGISPINFLSKEEARNFLSSKFQVPSSKFIIGTVANLYKTKGLEYLIEVAKLLTTHSSQLTTIIIGEGSERKNLERLIKKYSLEKNVILAGRIDNVAELLTAFDIYVCSSVKEGLSYTIMEAMLAGLPIVATDVGGNAELIENYKTGLLVEAKNTEILAEKIKELIDNAELGKKLGENAKAKVENKFNLKRMVKETEVVYDSF